MKFHVIRRHRGDKLYMPGDTREASEASVAHLVRNGVLSAEKPKKKAESAPQNKMEAAPANKAAK